MEHQMATHQGRGARAKMKIYANRTGEILGLNADLLIDAGAYAQVSERWRRGGSHFR